MQVGNLNPFPEKIQTKDKVQGVVGGRGLNGPAENLTIKKPISVYNC